MKEKFYVIAILFYVVFSCIMGSVFLISHTKLKLEKEKNKILSEKVISQLNIIGLVDLSSKIVLVDDYGQTTSFRYALNGKPKLIVQISDTSHKKVMESLLPQLHNLSKQIGENNIILLTSSANSQGTQIFCQENQLRYPLFKIKDDGIKCKAVSLKSSSFYIVTPDFRVHLDFTPDEKLPDLNRLYFSQVKDFFKKSGLLDKILQFEKSEIDLGKIKIGKKYPVDFKFKNTMNSPLVIHQVKTSCGCTVADWEKKPIKSEAFSKIRVEYTADQKGYFFKTIRVSSNAENKVIELRIKGVVV